MNDNDTIMIC